MKQEIQEQKFMQVGKNAAKLGESIDLADEKIRKLTKYIQRLKAEQRQRERLLDEEYYARHEAFEKQERDKQLTFEQELIKQKLQF